MAYHPKTGEQSFNSSWQKAVAWAQSNGIGPSSYLPVYQLDLTRLQNGQYPMGAAERNLSIMAAHNPNQVTSNPADHPASPFTPSGAFNNARSDVGKIATGLAGIFTGSFEKQVWNSAKTTFEGVVHPATLEGSTFGGTVANWLNKTMLSFVPGLADIGTVLQADPSLTGSSGVEALAQHPLLSILDVLPGGGGALERVARKAGATEIAASLAKHGGGFDEVGRMIGGIKTGKEGVSLATGKPGTLTVADRIQAFAARGGKGVGPALSHLGNALQTTSAMGSDMYTWLMDGPTQAAKDLKPEEVAFVQKVLDPRRTDGGDLYRKTMEDPNVSPKVKDFMRQWLNGPRRFATEEEAFFGGIAPVDPLTGEKSSWFVPKGLRASRVFKARNAMRAAEKSAINSVVNLAPHVERVEKLDQALPIMVDAFGSHLGQTRQEVFNDPALQLPLTRDLPNPTRLRKKASLSRKDQVHAVVDEGGIADQFLKAAKAGEPDLVEELSKMMRERLSAWGPKSINAAELRAKNPSLGRLYDIAVAMEQWAKMRKKESAAIHKSIHGEIARQEHMLGEQIAHRSEQMQILKARQTREREELDETYRRKKAQSAAKLADITRRAREDVTISVNWIRTAADAEARRATRNVLDTQIMPRVRREEKAITVQAQASIKQATKDYLAERKLAWTEKQRDSSRMARRHYDETRTFKKQIEGEKVGMGEDLRAVRAYGKTIQAFHEAVMDNPSDAYRDVRTELLYKHILTAERSSALMVATDKILKNTPKMTERKLAQLRSDPQVVYDLFQVHAKELMHQPGLNPEVATQAVEQLGEYEATANEELKQLIGQGLRIEYIPSATAFDERLGRDSMAPMIGHGIPKPDIAKEKLWDVTPNKYDFALGITKATAQALQRDSTIYFAEHYLAPLVTSRVALDNYLNVAETEKIVNRAANVTAGHVKMVHTADELGLTKFDPKGLFGFQLPRWAPGEENYLPTALVGALKEFEATRKKGLLAKGNKLFRYSILGLSPRYDAHIIFGGTMMLALRSTPYMPLMLGQAWRALRDGTLPQGVLRGTAELGFEEPIDVIHRKLGEDAGNMAVGEHIETVQKIKAGAAKPIHVLRALADLNLRAMNHVRDMQAAVSYLDGAAKATRREGKIQVEDPETGRMISVTPDRAIAEGVHHVQEVFGNLRAMSPFERHVASTYMPFYGWQKHILGYIMRFPFDHPWRALVLSQMAENSSNEVPLAWPIRLQFLHFLGAPDAQGNVSAIDLRSLDPFRDVANYASLQGFFQALSPGITALPSVANPEFTYGSSQLYPGVTYNDFYGIRTATGGGSWINAVEQFVPQTAAVQSALSAAGGARSMWQTNKSSAIKSLLNSLNVPFVTPPVNLRQLAAKGEASRFEVAKAAAAQAFQSGDFSGLAGYKTVPNPLNSAYEITPKQLETLYKQAQQATPGVAPIESLLPPQTPYGW